MLIYYDELRRISDDVWLFLFYRYYSGPSHWAVDQDELLLCEL